MKPLDWACGECAAQPNEPCVGMPVGEYHAKRVATSEYWAKRTGAVPDVKDLDVAVEQSGLV